MTHDYFHTLCKNVAKVFKLQALSSTLGDNCRYNVTCTIPIRKWSDRIYFLVCVWPHALIVSRVQQLTYPMF